MNVPEAISWISESCDYDTASLITSCEIADVELQPLRYVLPRDAFNIAKLYKSLGRLSLLQHHGELGSEITAHWLLNSSLNVLMDVSNGGLFCPGMLFVVGDSSQQVSPKLLYLISAYNCKDSYSLVMLDRSLGWVEVLNADSGDLTEQFKSYISTFKRR